MADEDKNIVEELDEKKFKELVISWVSLDDQIRKASEKMRDLRNEKKQFEEYILAFMEKYDEDTITLHNGLLKRNVSQAKGSLKEDLIQEAIKEITRDNDKAYEMTKFIMEKRPINEKVSLKRSIRKDRKKA
jgi:hypothetical protein